MKVFSPACLFLLSILTFTPAYGQRGSTTAGAGTAMSNVPMNGSSGIEPLDLKIVDEKLAKLDRQAVVRVTDENTKRATWQPTSKDSEVRFEDLGPGKYDVEVNAIGYLTGRKEVQLVGESHPMHLQLVLHPDPDAIDFTGTDSSLSPKASKELDKGLNDFKAGKWKDAQKHFENVSNQAPNSAYANFLLGYAQFMQNDFDHAMASLTKATTLDPKDVQALNLLGRVHLVKRDFAGAKTVEEQAVAVVPDNPAAHGELADAYLNLGDYKNALDQAEIALDKGKSKASNAEIVRGEALADLGRNQEALQALNDYLQNAPDTASGPQVQQLIATVEQRVPKPATTQKQ